MEKTIIHQGKKLFYVVRGEGIPVIFLHGFAEDGSIWDAVASVLEQEYRLIIPDLPGSGQSELTTDLTMETMADAVKAIIDEENIRQTVIIGHSMGGYVSLAFAANYPASVTALGLFHSSAYADDEEKIATRKKNIDFIKAHGTPSFLKQATPTLFSDASKKGNPQLVEALINRYKDFDPASLIACQQAMIARPQRLNVLENIVKPVLMIIGREDKAIPFELSMKQSHLPSCAYLHVLEKSGHMGMQEEFNTSVKILQDLLADLEPPVDKTLIS